MSGRLEGETDIAQLVGRTVEALAVTRDATVTGRAKTLGVT
jgi:hypothetical protein